MTTAHRPTWKAAVGRANTGGWSAGGAVSTAVSALEVPGQLSLKTLRKEQTDKKRALRESLLALEKAEASLSSKKKQSIPKRKLDPAIEERAQQRLLAHAPDKEVDVEAMKAKYDDSDVEDDDNDGSDADNPRNNGKTQKNGNDNDDDTDLDDSDSDLDDDSSDDDDDDDEDDEEALKAELAKIRQEREAAKRKAAEEEAALEQEKDESAALVGNPLLAMGGCTAATTKRRWNDDVVFRNQAKGEPKVKKRFINDTVRSDFHKKFLNKYIR